MSEVASVTSFQMKPLPPRGTQKSEKRSKKHHKHRSKSQKKRHESPRRGCCRPCESMDSSISHQPAVTTQSQEKSPITDTTAPLSTTPEQQGVPETPASLPQRPTGLHSTPQDDSGSGNFSSYRSLPCPPVVPQPWEWPYTSQPPAPPLYPSSRPAAAEPFRQLDPPTMGRSAAPHPGFSEPPTSRKPAPRVIGSLLRPTLPSERRGCPSASSTVPLPTQDAARPPFNNRVSTSSPLTSAPSSVTSAPGAQKPLPIPSHPVVDAASPPLQPLPLLSRNASTPLQTYVPTAQQPPSLVSPTLPMQGRPPQGPMSPTAGLQIMPMRSAIPSIFQLASSSGSGSEPSLRIDTSPPQTTCHSDQKSQEGEPKSTHSESQRPGLEIQVSREKSFSSNTPALPSKTLPPKQKHAKPVPASSPTPTTSSQGQPEPLRAEPQTTKSQHKGSSSNLSRHGAPKVHPRSSAKPSSPQAPDSGESVVEIIEETENEVVDVHTIVSEKIVEREVEQVHEVVNNVVKDVVEERVVEVPDIEIKEIDVVRTVEIPSLQEHVIVKEKPINHYIDKPIPEVKTVKVNLEVPRLIPIPVEQRTTVEMKLPKIVPIYEKVKVPVYLPRFIEIPIAGDAVDESFRRRCDAICEEVAHLAAAAQLQSVSLCKLESVGVDAKGWEVGVEMGLVQGAKTQQDRLIQLWKNGAIRVRQDSSIASMSTDGGSRSGSERLTSAHQKSCSREGSRLEAQRTLSENLYVSDGHAQKPSKRDMHRSSESSLRRIRHADNKKPLRPCRAPSEEHNDDALFSPTAEDEEDEDHDALHDLRQRIHDAETPNYNDLTHDFERAMFVSQDTQLDDDDDDEKDDTKYRSPLQP